MKYRSLASFKKGFTLIELLIVLSVIGIISTVSIVSFVSYNKSSVLKQASLDVASLLRDAKSRTQSQRKPSSCTGTLIGYRVDICGLSTSNCSTANTYRLSMVCSGNTTVLSTKSLPSDISFSSSSTSPSFLFQVLSNGVTGSGFVRISGYNTTQDITVGSGGTVTIN
ncbi:MAG: prepilin-type N-terminal cleavage/methylation domain-containing protein [Candidatus Levybacteria bacterium]|nr:prepilin-type N-terminal cleavage/methylation domain-containing protein [Candidatus Levybacteria bacterium]